MRILYLPFFFSWKVVLSPPATARGGRAFWLSGSLAQLDSRQRAMLANGLHRQPRSLMSCT